MPRIQQLTAISQGVLEGVSIFPIDAEKPRAGAPQSILVRVVPDGLIPLHTHEVDAKMIIVGGSGEVLSASPDLNGQSVTPGMVVFFEKSVAHGFRAGAYGLYFISQNGGIVDEDSGKWDIAFN